MRITRSARFTTSKFQSICAETGKQIDKGDSCLYFPEEKSVYHITSKVAQDFRKLKNS